jgi:hypothetical protein
MGTVSSLNSGQTAKRGRSAAPLLCCHCGGPRQRGTEARRGDAGRRVVEAYERLLAHARNVPPASDKTVYETGAAGL